MSAPPTTNDAHPDGTLDEASADAGAPSIGPYRVRRALGRGGMGEVFEAWDPRLERVVAVKRIVDGRRRSARARARFWREARALGAVQHPGVVAIHDIGETPDGDLYLAMALVDGERLGDLLLEPWPVERVATLGVRLADALAAAHAAGITHRDLKPSNVIVDRAGEPRLVDFGLARRGEGDDDQVTAVGAAVGTPAYMAPEQIEGRPVGPAADVWSLGVLLYRALAGAHPFARDSQGAMTAAILAGAARPLSDARPDADPALAAIIGRCLSPEPAARYAGGAPLRDALAALIEARGWPPAPLPLRELALDRAEEPPALSTDGASEPPAARRRRPGRRGWLGAAALAVVAAALLPATLSRDDGVEAAPVSLERLWLPARPIVAVGQLAVEPDTQANRAYAAAFEEALRALLGHAPEAVRVLPRVISPDVGAAAPGEADRPAAGGLDERATIGGRLVFEDDGAVVADLSLRGRSGPAVAPLYARGPGHEPMAIARAAATELVRALGVADPALPDVSFHPASYGRFVVAQGAYQRAEHEVARAAVDEALAADPTFAPARLLSLELRLSEPGRAPTVVAEGAALLASGRLAPRDRAYLEVLIAAARGDNDAVYERLRALLDRWPHDVDALNQMVGLLFRGGRYAALDQVIPVAQTLFALAPHHAVNAGRLVRAMAWRGRGEEAHALLSAAGIGPETPGAAKVFGELRLYEGDYDGALALFEREHDASTRHWAMIARMLAGDCVEAAADAARRVHDAGRGTDPGHAIEWTYSLWLFATICAEQPVRTHEALERWIEVQPRYSSFRQHVLIADHFLEGRLDVLAKDVEERLLSGDEEQRWLAYGLARWVATDPVRLREWAADARRRATAIPDGSSHSRNWVWLAATLEARARLVEGDHAGAVEAFERLQLTPRDILVEAHLSDRVELRALLADALERAGRPAEAREAWGAVLQTHLGRVHRPWMAILACRRLRALNGEAPAVCGRSGGGPAGRDAIEGRGDGVAVPRDWKADPDAR